LYLMGNILSTIIDLRIKVSNRVSCHENENHLHLIIFSGKMQNIHRALRMDIPHQPARSYMRSRMVELAMVYFLTARLAFLLFLCFCELGYLLAVLLRTPESHVTSFSLLMGGTDWEKFCGLNGLQTLSSSHHLSRYTVHQCCPIDLPLGEEI